MVLLALVCLSTLACRKATADQFAPESTSRQLVASNDVEKHASAKLIADVDAVQPGKSFRLGVDLTMDPGWHTYYKDCGEAGMPTKIEWTLPKGFHAGEVQWEKPDKFVDTGIVTYGYHDRTLIAASIAVPADVKPGESVKITALVKWLTCKDICLPGEQTVEISLPVAAASAAVHQINQDRFAKVGWTGNVSSLTEDTTTPPAASTASSTDASGGSGRGGAQGKSTDILDAKLQLADSGQSQSLAFYLLSALIGGLILNVMPCVLPVIAIKVLSFMQQAQDEPSRVRQLGLVFSGGIISSFLALALIVILVQQAGQKIGWGFQFQYPGFVIAMSVIVLLFALSLFGLFYIQVNVGQESLDKLASKEGFVGTFFKGVLATVLSTPCTAPFLGTALGFAFAKSPWVVLAIFFTIGLGMSLPYIVLTANPAWMKFIPKPGVWMEKFKESLGFILLATVVWLLSVLGSQVGTDGVIWTSGFLVAVAFAAWLIARFTDLSSEPRRKFTVWAIAASCVVASFYFCIAIRPGIGFLVPATAMESSPLQSSEGPVTEGGITWLPFNVDALNKALTDGKTVLIDFTAQWCLTCKVNETTVLMSSPVRDKLKALNVVTMKADWTKQDPTITKLLNKFGRSGVPLYVIFPAGNPTQPIVLPEVITQSMMVEKLSEAGPSKS